MALEREVHALGESAIFDGDHVQEQVDRSTSPKQVRAVKLSRSPGCRWVAIEAIGCTRDVVSGVAEHRELGSAHGARA